MARLEVVQIRCDRCKRCELQAPQPKKDRPDFEMRLLNTPVKYDDLCSGCQAALEHTLRNIGEWQREIKQVFGPKPGAVPLTPAPDYTPPKPHSMAAAKK